MLGGECPQRLDQAEGHGEFADGRRFAAGDDQPRQAFEVRRQTDLAPGDPQSVEGGEMFGEVSLEGKHSDRRGCSHDELSVISHQFTVKLSPRTLY
jgi:hypothetical protein